jgi:hypothetical protein
MLMGRAPARSGVAHARQHKGANLAVVYANSRVAATRQENRRDVLANGKSGLAAANDNGVPVLIHFSFLEGDVKQSGQ